MAADRFISKNLDQELVQEVSRENLDNLQSVDLICAYLSKTGWENLRPLFYSLASRSIQVRVLTTSQFSFSDPYAIDALARLPKVNVKIFRKEQDPTFHAKGWLFIRGNGNHSAIVGSSNMSQSAMTQGIEFNTRNTAPEIILGFRNAFEEYWSGRHWAFNEGNVLDYNHARDWETLLSLFPSQIVPECDDINNVCNHPSCLQLRQTLQEQHNAMTRRFSNRGSTRRVREEVEISLESENGGIVYVDPTSSYANVHVGPISSAQDNISVANNHGHAEPPSIQDLQNHLLQAILDNNEQTVLNVINTAKQRGQDLLKESGSVKWSLKTVDKSILKRAQKVHEYPQLEGYELGNPLLFAIAFSRKPSIVKIILQEGSKELYQQLKHGSSRVPETKNIFHVLSSMDPLKACQIFKEISEDLLEDSADPWNCKAMDDPFSNAEYTARNCSRMTNHSFVEALDKYYKALKTRESGLHRSGYNFYQRE
jgi:HKD family nuclease